MSENGRDINFYTELVLVTVLSLIAANIWTKAVFNTMEYYHPSKLWPYYVAAIIATVAGIVILHLAFSMKESPFSRKASVSIPYYSAKERFLSERNQTHAHQGLHHQR